MANLGIGDLLITLNGTFVRSKEDLARGGIDQLFEAARVNEDPDLEVLLEIYEEPVGRATVSALAYYSRREAYFIADKDVYDTIASYFILVVTSPREFCILKKSCAPTGGILDKNYEIVGFSDLIKTFDDSKSQIQKLSAREMGVSDKGIRFRSYEAPDLKGHMSPHAAGRSIPRFTTVRSKDEIRSISLNRGRINQLSDRVSVDVAAQWVADVFTAMKSVRVNNSFFSAGLS